MQRIGRYQVSDELGRGGMGRVYRAHDPELDRAIAIKVLHGPHAGSFRDEARALAALNHPGIVTIHEIGDHEGRPFLVMELLRGRPLRELLQHAAMRPTRDRLIEICASVAVATAEAHANGVLHRDLKPENVMVLEGGTVKVIDFGIARRLDGDHALEQVPDEAGASRALRIVSAFTHTLPLSGPPIDPSTQATAPADTDATLASAPGDTQTLFGTPAYMAPEVLMTEPSSPASDVYSLGVMLYECLAGRRPYDAPNLVEVVTRVLEGGDPPPLADPLAPLVARMMARDPAARPTCREVALALAPPRPSHVDAPPPRPRSRAALVAALVAGAGVLGVVGWRLTRSTPSTATTRAAALVAVQPLEVSYRAYQPDQLAEVLAIVLGSIEGVQVVEPSQLHQGAGAGTAFADAARGVGARYLVRGKLVETDAGARAEIELVDLRDDRAVPITVEGSVVRNAALVVDLANAIADRVAPGAKLDAAVRVALARRLHDRGRALLTTHQWYQARPYLEQAVLADPSLTSAWDALASARGWTLAPQEQIEEAIGRALAGAPEGPRRTILQGAAAYLRHDFDAALTTLAPLRDDTGLPPDDALDLAYYLGEAYWHRGEHTRGAEHLRRVLDARPTFKPAAVHVMQHAIAHRDLARAGHLIGVLGHRPEAYQFVAGEYAAVAASEQFPLNLQAQLVLGEDPPPAREDKLGTGPDAAAYRIARALGRGDRAAARAAFQAAWARIEPQPATDRLLFELGNFAEVVTSSGLADETRRLLAFLARGSSPRYVETTRRLTTLAAPLISGAPARGGRGETPRDRRLAAAATAELAQDHRTAATLLAELVADPSDAWAYPERIALIRNLRALRDRPALAQQCDEIARPPVFRYAFLIARRACDEALSRI